MKNPFEIKICKKKRKFLAALTLRKIKKPVQIDNPLILNLLVTSCDNQEFVCTVCLA